MRGEAAGTHAEMAAAFKDSRWINLLIRPILMPLVQIMTQTFENFQYVSKFLVPWCGRMSTVFVVDDSFSFYPWLSKLRSLCGRPEALKRCCILLGEMQIVSISGYQLMIFITDKLFSNLTVHTLCGKACPRLVLKSMLRWQSVVWRTSKPLPVLLFFQ